MLLLLPTEILEAVCRFLDARSVIAFAQVSRKCLGIFQHSSALQYNVHLEFAGLRDGPSGNGSASRLQALKSYRIAWAGFDCTRAVKSTTPMQGRHWDLVGNVLGTYDSEKGFSFLRIPGPIRNVPPAQWSVGKLLMPLGDFTMDLSQDLLVVVEATSGCLFTHLFSLQTGGPHPAARISRLSREDDAPNLPPTFHTFQIRIFGDHIGVLAESNDTGGTELQIWEWKTGVSKKHARERQFTSFAFLDNRRILLSVLHLHRSGVQPELRVLEIDGPEDDLGQCLSLELPGISAQDLDDVTMLIQTEPCPSWPAESPPEEPFTTCHTDRLFVVSLQGWEAVSYKEPTFLLCLRLSTILAFCSAPLANTVIPWDQWGPANTRMLRIPQFPDPWVCFVFGQRCIVQLDDKHCKILDFNSLSTASQNRIVGAKTVDKRMRLFTRPVTTSAPFTLQTVQVPESAAFMLAEDAIVAVSPDEDQFTIYSV